MPRRLSVRRIAIVTGSRAEFGLLAPVMSAIRDFNDTKTTSSDRRSTRLDLKTIVAGLHLTQGTWRDVKKAGFNIDARVRMQSASAAGRYEDVQAIARGVGRFGQVFQQLQPHVVLVLGDRIEAFAAATAAAIAGIHLAHIHGGDRAEGVADESMRHAISKLAHLHFPASAQSAERLKKMGEHPKTIFRVGSPAIDGLRAVTPAPDAPQMIVLQHPIGGPDETEQKRMIATLRATRHMSRLVLSPNADPGSQGIRRAIRDAGIEPVQHLPRQRWLSLLAGAQVLVGNSSAGLIEAAALKTSCVNIGPRQAGRQRPANVIDADYTHASIRKAIDRALTLDLRRARHPYGDGRASARIARTLGRLDLNTIPIRKQNTY